MNSVSEMVDEFNALEAKLEEIEENTIMQVYNSDVLFRV